MRACWSLPVRDSGGRVIGSLAVYYREPRKPEAWERELAEVFGSLVALAVEHRRQDEALANSERRLRSCCRIAPNTLYRGPRMERFLRRHNGRIDRGVIEEGLRDHFSAPAAICRHADSALPAEKRVITVAAILIDLDDRVLHVTDGPPCEAPFQSFPLYAGGSRSGTH